MSLTINGMEDFQNLCREKLCAWYSKHDGLYLKMEDTFVVWCCKTLQNYKCLVSTTIPGDGIYAEYTFNGDKGEIYEDVYKKLTNTVIKER